MTFTYICKHEISPWCNESYIRMTVRFFYFLPLSWTCTSTKIRYVKTSKPFCILPLLIEQFASEYSFIRQKIVSFLILWLLRKQLPPPPKKNAFYIFKTNWFRKKMIFNIIRIVEMPSNVLNILTEKCFPLNQSGIASNWLKCLV